MQIDHKINDYESFQNHLSVVNDDNRMKKGMVAQKPKNGIDSGEESSPGFSLDYEPPKVHPPQNN